MTIAQVFDSCSSQQKNTIIASIMLKGISYSTAFTWCTGGRPPKPYARPMVAQIVSDATGIDHTEAELWPAEQ